MTEAENLKNKGPLLQTLNRQSVQFVLTAPERDEPRAQRQKGASRTPRARDGGSLGGESGEDHVRGLPEELHLR